MNVKNLFFVSRKKIKNWYIGKIKKKSFYDLLKCDEAIHDTRSQSS